MRALCPLAILGFLAACGSTENALMKAAMAYQNCMTVSQYFESTCAAERAAYEKDLAAFKTTYAK
jgi:hypothetical protein